MAARRRGRAGRPFTRPHQERFEEVPLDSLPAAGKSSDKGVYSVSRRADSALSAHTTIAQVIRPFETERCSDRDRVAPRSRMRATPSSMVSGEGSWSRGFPGRTGCRVAQAPIARYVPHVVRVLGVGGDSRVADAPASQRGFNRCVWPTVPDLTTLEEMQPMRLVPHN